MVIYYIISIFCVIPTKFYLFFLPFGNKLMQIQVLCSWFSGA